MEKELNVSALGHKVKEYRMRRGYSAEKLGKIAGVSKSHINNIETANSRASAEVLVRIANALDVSIDVLLCDSLEGNASQKARLTEYAKMLEGCNEREVKIIVDTVKSLRDSLREEDI